MFPVDLGFVLLLDEPIAGSDVQFELIHHPRVLFSPLDKFLQRNLTWTIHRRNKREKKHTVQIRPELDSVNPRRGPTHCLCSCPPVQIFGCRCRRCSPRRPDRCASWSCWWSEKKEQVEVSIDSFKHFWPLENFSYCFCKKLNNCTCSSEWVYDSGSVSPEVEMWELPNLDLKSNFGFETKTLSGATLLTEVTVIRCK